MHLRAVGRVAVALLVAAATCGSVGALAEPVAKQAARGISSGTSADDRDIDTGKITEVHTGATGVGPVHLRRRAIVEAGSGSGSGSGEGTFSGEGAFWEAAVGSGGASGSMDPCVCRKTWTSPGDGGDCGTPQHDCPSRPCDSSEHEPWCLVANSPCAGEADDSPWAYCTPRSPSSYRFEIETSSTDSPRSSEDHDDYADYADDHDYDRGDGGGAGDARCDAPTGEFVLPRSWANGGLAGPAYLCSGSVSVYFYFIFWGRVGKSK